MQDHPDNEGKGKITIPWKWRDEEGELDLSNPTDLEKAKMLVNKGYGYEKGQEKLREVQGELDQSKTQIEYWNGLMQEAESTGDASKVLAALEMSGVKLSKSDQDDDDVILDAGEKKYGELEKKIDRLEGALYNRVTDDMHSRLEAKYNDGKYPEYNRKTIEDFANKKGIRDFDDAYFIMNKDKLLEVEKQDDNDKTKKHNAKVKKVASKEPGSGTIPSPPPKKSKDYAEVGRNWKDDPSITEGLFVDEQ